MQIRNPPAGGANAANIIRGIRIIIRGIRINYMELKELKLKTEKELTQILNEFRDKLRDLRFKDANKQLKDVREIREIKKTIARILTLISANKLVKK